MRYLALRRDRPSGAVGLAGAIAGPLLVVGLVSAIAGLIAASQSSMREVVLLFGINAIMVVGYQVFVGSTGIVSFGHVAFMAVGAYAGGIAAIPVDDKVLYLPELPGFLADIELAILPALVLGGAAAALLALVTGFALMRLSGEAAAIAMLGLLVIVNNVLSQAGSITRGPQALFGVPESTNFFWVFVTLVAVVCISGFYKWSRSGLRARATRDDAVASESAGVSLLSSRLAPFVLSAFITGVGGALYAHLLTAYSPNSFFVPQVVVVLTMAIIGGVNSITGVLTGAVAITVLNDLMRRLEDGVSLGGLDLSAPTGISAAVLGVMLILTMRWRPSGMLGAMELQVETTTSDRPRDQSAGPTPPA